MAQVRLSHISKTHHMLGRASELYKEEGDFSIHEIISNKTSLTGVYPFEMVMNDGLRQRLNDLNVVPISEYDTALSLGGDWNTDDVLLVWFVPRSLKKKKTARGAEYWILEVIDENNIIFIDTITFFYSFSSGDIIIIILFK